MAPLLIPRRLACSLAPPTLLVEYTVASDARGVDDNVKHHRLVFLSGAFAHEPETLAAILRDSFPDLYPLIANEQLVRMLALLRARHDADAASTPSSTSLRGPPSAASSVDRSALPLVAGVVQPVAAALQPTPSPLAATASESSASSWAPPAPQRSSPKARVAPVFLHPATQSQTLASTAGRPLDDVVRAAGASDGAPPAPFAPFHAHASAPRGSSSSSSSPRGPQGVPPAPPSFATAAAVAGARPVDRSLAQLATSIGDLQRAGPASLQAAKAKMEVVFAAMQVKPGQEGYVYDKRVEFSSDEVEPSDWDA